MTSPAYERVGDPDDAGPFVFCCEHASNALPPWLSATDGDLPLLADHWGWDIGAADTTRALVAELGGQAVLARFSRLVVDPNRRTEDPTYIVHEVDGSAVSFNAAVDDAERARRTTELYQPYHAAIDAVLAARIALGPPVRLVSIHSFTPMFLGRRRPMEVGVLFDDFDEHAWHLESALAEQGFESALNAPYSGKPPDGLIHAARSHGRRHGVEYLELEIRQDLIDTAAAAAAIAKRIAAALAVFRP